MKTTLNLEDSLLREAKKRAAEDGRTLTSVVEEGLRRVLTQEPTGEPYRFRPLTVRGTRPPAVDLDDHDALSEFMERGD